MSAVAMPERTEQLIESAVLADWRHFYDEVTKCAFKRALAWLSSTQRLAGLEEIWHGIPVAGRAQLLADTISTSDLLRNNLGFIVNALTECRERGELILDCHEAHGRFAERPDQVEVFRGTVYAERFPDLGVSWTLSPKVAQWFAGGYRCSNRASTPVILHAVVPKSAICGLLIERDELEALVLPAAFCKTRPRRLKWEWRA